MTYKFKQKTEEEKDLCYLLGELIGCLIVLAFFIALFCVFVYALFGGFGPIGVGLAILALFVKW